MHKSLHVCDQQQENVCTLQTVPRGYTHILQPCIREPCQIMRTRQYPAVQLTYDNDRWEVERIQDSTSKQIFQPFVDEIASST